MSEEGNIITIQLSEVEYLRAENDRLREALVEVRAFAAVISDQYWVEAVLAKVDAALTKGAGQ